MKDTSIYSKTYVPGIDGLRAIAVLSVLIYHLNSNWLPGGFVGVDIFFVISGYVISKSLAGSNSSSFSHFVLDFYRRRIVRIVPALAVFLLVISVVGVMFIPSGWLSDSNDLTALYAFFGLSNFYLVSTADGYFGARIPFNPFVHTWSLAVEEQFYVFFPAIFYLWLRQGRHSTFYGAAARAALPILVLSSLIVAAYQTSAAHDHAFYLLPGRFWELGAGALLYQWTAGKSAFAGTPGRSQCALLAGMTLIVVAFYLTDARLFPFPWAVVPIMGSGLIILGVTGAANSRQGLNWVLNLRPVVYVGRISYSLYLWHWGVFTLFRWTVGLSSFGTMSAAVLLAFGLAALSYRYPETFFRSSTSIRRASSRRVVVIGVCSLAVACFGTSSVFGYRNMLGLSVTAAWDNNEPEGYERDVLPVSNEGTGKTVFVVGDSHAGAYTLMASSAAAAVGARAIVITNSGCPIAQLVREADAGAYCHEVESGVVARLRAEGKAGDIVFLASLRVDRFGDQWVLFDETGASDESASKLERQHALIQAEKLVKELREAGFHVLFDAPKPLFKAPPFRCSDWFNKRNPICAAGFEIGREVLLNRRKPAMDSLQRLRETQAIFVWDPFPTLCEQSSCSAFDGDKAIFFDGDHLTSYGNRLLVRSFLSQIQQIWGLPQVSAAFIAPNNAPARFIPVAPCRLVDTRLSSAYPISGGRMAAGESRSFALPSSACGIPPNALAYSVNATVVPTGSLRWLTLWPSGQPMPAVSTLNSVNGRIKANAAIVPAAAGGAVSAYVTDASDLILDINGYFVAAGSGGDLAFYPLAPCRVSDTRNPVGTNGGPVLEAGQTRTISPWGVCGIPSGAAALSLNYTVVPRGPLDWLTTWPTGQAKPAVSTLNALAGTVVANAAIVSTGGNGQINIYVTNTTDVVVDVNGYFAPAGAPGALAFYATTPCRVADTRLRTGPFGGPQTARESTRRFAVSATAPCAIPASAQAYSLNATVVPSGGLGWLTVWPSGTSPPAVSTLNAWDGAVTSNAVLVPAGTRGAINAYLTDTTDLILDINGYFAP